MLLILIRAHFLFTGYFLYPCPCSDTDFYSSVSVKTNGFISDSDDSICGRSNGYDQNFHAMCFLGRKRNLKYPSCWLLLSIVWSFLYPTRKHTFFFHWKFFSSVSLNVVKKKERKKKRWSQRSVNRKKSKQQKPKNRRKNRDNRQRSSILIIWHPPPFSTE